MNKMFLFNTIIKGYNFNRPPMQNSSRQLQRQDNIPTLPISKHPVMTQQFMHVYEDMLQLSNIRKQLNIANVLISQKQYIHEVYNTNSPGKPHLVLLHGFGATSMAFLKMFQHLKNHFQIHALDLYGFGLSSRGTWKQNMHQQQIISYFINALESWRQAMQIPSFMLGGHSFGCLLSTYYLQRYPQRVTQLFFLSPAGVSTWTQEQIAQRAKTNSYFRWPARVAFNMHLRPTIVISKCVCCFSKMAMNNLLVTKLGLSQEEREVWQPYIRMVSDQEVSSQSGFYSLLEWPEVAKRSIETVMEQIKPTIPIHFFYGDRDWIQPKGAHKLSQKFNNFTVTIVEDSGHQMPFNNPEAVSKKILQFFKQSQILQ